jgi:leucyl-tRNA synthetase
MRTCGAATPSVGQSGGEAASEITAVCVRVSSQPAFGKLNLSRVRTYAIADMLARFWRARGAAVLFAPSIDAFAPGVDAAAMTEEIPPAEWVERWTADMRKQCELLAFSFDWSRAVLNCDEELLGWSQWLFLVLLENGLVYKDATGTWHLRVASLCEAGYSTLTDLRSWSPAAVLAQRRLLAAVDGYELTATALDGRSLIVFTPFLDAVAEAKFVAISPAHPDLGQWVASTSSERISGSPKTPEQGANGRPVQTGALVQVPGAQSLLPVVISSSVDARFGPTAILGIPSHDVDDAAIQEQLGALQASAWRTADKSAAPRSARRHRVSDRKISSTSAWGPAIPVVHCESCGTVPVPRERLPVLIPHLRAPTNAAGDIPEQTRSMSCRCPSCGEAAQPDGGTINWQFDALLQSLALVVPAAERAHSLLDHEDIGRWLPSAHYVHDSDSCDAVFAERAMAKLLHARGELADLAEGEPHAGAFMHESVSPHAPPLSDTDSDQATAELVERFGADAVRLAVLHGCAPEKRLQSMQAVAHCQRFLTRLREYARARLTEQDIAADTKIDTSEPLRRRLERWCDIAIRKTSQNLEEIRPHKATRNTMALLERIEDFERRTIDARGELGNTDSAAIAAALLVLVRLIEPLAPHVANELWAVAAQPRAIAQSPWPGCARSA